nr:hypothetical protein [Tanacetum cinerariifolium]
MGDEHFNTISATESDELIKSCVENLVPNPKFVFENSYAEIESFSPSPIPIEDSDYIMEEMDLYCTSDDPIPLSIEENDYDSERDVLILEELLDNYSLSFPVIESFCFDIPSFSHPPAKPPDGNTEILNIKMMGDDSEQKPSAKYPMMIHGKDIPILDVPFFHFYPLINSSMGELAGQFWYECAPPQVTQFGSTALTIVGVEDEVEAEDWFFLSRSNTLTISLSSATSDEIAGVEELVLTLITTALARD